MSNAALKTIDAAWQSAKVPCHRHDLDDRAREHLEYAIAHLNEAWRAQDGQAVRTPKQLHGDMQSALAMCKAIAAEHDKKEKSA